MHAPSHLREALQEYLDSDIPAKEFRVEHDGEEGYSVSCGIARTFCLPGTATNWTSRKGLPTPRR